MGLSSENQAESDLHKDSQVLPQTTASSEDRRPIDEETPLFSAGRDRFNAIDGLSTTVFFCIEVALFSNVFLSGFDGTVTATTYATIGSEFHASNTASWITTSYLLASTAIQPLYGRFSDIFGRRACFLFASVMFALGCLGCGLSADIVTLNAMRALTGIGGGGLVTMATIINSDIVSPKHRGMYQSFQNVSLGMGAVSGASFGGAIADLVGWRFCFLLQLPISILAIVCGYLVIGDHRRADAAEASLGSELASVWRQVDIPGSFLLVLGLAAQLGALSLGGNEYKWTDLPVVALFATSLLLLVAFVVVECTTTAVPVIPMKLFRGVTPLACTVCNVCMGVSGYGFLFTMPLFFQAVLLDTPSRAGLRMMIPAMMTPIGGLVAGLIMSRNGSLRKMIWVGLGLVVLGNGLILTLKRANPHWMYIVYLLPAGLGQGMAYPSLLFTFIRMADTSEHAVATSVTYLTRSVGAVWGVAVTSTIIQSSVANLLPTALRNVAGYEQIVEDLRHSLHTLHTLDPEVRSLAQGVYYESIGKAFMLVETTATIALVSSLLLGAKKEKAPQ